jgi:multimeric flavodoxin WrbA
MAIPGAHGPGGKRPPMEVIDLAALKLSAFDYEHRNRGDDFEALIHHVLDFEQIIFASPVYWYAVSPTMKIFVDRLSDLLDLPDLLASGRRLREKTAYVLCTSIEDEATPAFVTAWQETFAYLGMRYGGLLHANCRDGYLPEQYQRDVDEFLRRLQGGTDPR